jgi:hypothetical protein
METESDLESIAKELDAIHNTARQAFRARDLDAYRELFTDDLRYIQPDGVAIGREQLMGDVGKQLAQFKAVDSDVTRESIAMNDDGTVTQILRQNGVYTVSVFFIFTKTWKIQRHGRYTYRMTDNGWRICHVEVLSEAVNGVAPH